MSATLPFPPDDWEIFDADQFPLYGLDMESGQALEGQTLILTDKEGRFTGNFR